MSFWTLTKRGCARDRRYFYIDPLEKRLYYSTSGPSVGGGALAIGNYHHDNCQSSPSPSSSFFGSLAAAVSLTYHKIVDGEEAGCVPSTDPVCFLTITRKSATFF